MLSESVGFLVFSTIEGVGLFVLMLSIFRLKATDYMWQALFMILLMNLQSFFLRNELSLAYIVPLVNIVLFIFLLNTVVKISLVWAGIVSIAGYLAFAIIQTLILLVYFGSIDAAQSSIGNGYLTQSLSGVISVLIAWGLYKFGIGFTFDFDRFRLKWEGIIVVLLIIIFLLVFTALLYKNELSLNIVFFICSLLFLLYYALIKEKFND
ncbi:hypothetical protein J2T13_005323 [Paenibacillus sp. DS2015]|uniref:hypothetical protein n=1 Tax=Paenibacillus sp. DS2015 TaxID=3373917 RepID=UPI003D1C0FA6